LPKKVLAISTVSIDNIGVDKPTAKPVMMSDGTKSFPTDSFSDANFPSSLMLNLLAFTRHLTLTQAAKQEL